MRRLVFSFILLASLGGCAASQAERTDPMCVRAADTLQMLIRDVKPGEVLNICCDADLQQWPSIYLNVSGAPGRPITLKPARPYCATLEMREGGFLQFEPGVHNWTIENFKYSVGAAGY